MEFVRDGGGFVGAFVDAEVVWLAKYARGSSGTMQIRVQASVPEHILHRTAWSAL